MSDTARHSQTQAEGNTRDPPPDYNTLSPNLTELINTEDTVKKGFKTRGWFFTLNNYTQEDIRFFTDVLDTDKYMFQEEIGTNGTPHLQGVIYFANARTFHQMKQLHRRVHWAVCRSIARSVEYCCKEDTRAPSGHIYYRGFTIPEPLDIISELRPWQQKVIEYINEKPNDRTIHWFYEQLGNTGKTSLCKYIIHHYKRVHYFTGGKAVDIAYQLISQSWSPLVCIFDLPRTSEDKVSYNAMEAIKNGLVQTGKYKGGTKLFNPPHILVFANWRPDTSALSRDRWAIHGPDFFSTE